MCLNFTIKAQNTRKGASICKPLEESKQVARPFPWGPPTARVCLQNTLTAITLQMQPLPIQKAKFHPKEYKAQGQDLETH